MTKPIHTPFFSGDHKPHCRGVFQRRRAEHLHVPNRKPRTLVRFALFEGGVWYCEAMTPSNAARNMEPSGYQNLEWRGLMEKAE